MLQIHEVHNIDLNPLRPDGVDIDVALKNYVLFTTINDATIVATSLKHLESANSYIAKFGNDYELVFLDEDSFERLFNKHLEFKTDKEVVNINDEETIAENEDDLNLAEFLRNSSDILTSEESAPIIKFVNSLFYQAVKQRASDIHIEVKESRGEVRFRVDGVLNKYIDLDARIVTLIISRIKVISNLDISETRIPQDGRTQVTLGKKVLDIRVSTLPSFYGERIVMRLLMHSSQIPKLTDLGFNELLAKGIDSLVKHSHGIILVTGPTGSGKSTTLHACLQQIASPQKNVITVEDPIEYKADNINQIQVNAKVGLSFAAGLRSILRQDPDVIMVGEIRDAETATIATQSALTGHLVLSTLHTNNATATITRLKDMGIEEFLISSTLLGVLAQRLVRTLCHECKEEEVLDQVNLEEFQLDGTQTFYKAKGCKACSYTGFTGRVAIGELLILNDDMKNYIKTTTDEYDLRQKALEQGLYTLHAQLKDLLYKGDVSLQEAVRVGLKDV